MKLRYSPTSPYVRKVTVAALETGLDARIVRVPTDIREPAADFLADNPLGKVPALVTDDGLTLIDSPLICEYLDTLHDGARLFPAEGTARWRDLSLMALADGITDAAVLRRMESVRPEKEQSPSSMERQRQKVVRGLDALEAHVPAFDQSLTIGQIAVACSLGYLDFRFAEEDWRVGRPMLADWYSMIMVRPSLVATTPRDG